MDTREIVCPNPRCRKKIRETVLLSILSSTTALHYSACPHCHAEINEYEDPEEREATVEERPQDACMHDRAAKDLGSGKASALKRIDELSAGAPKDPLDIIAPNRRFRSP